MSYYELWTILGNWRPEFSADDFARVFSSPDPRKVLSDMTNKGLLERLERGKYKVVNPDTYVKSKNNVEEAYDFLRRSRLSYALANADGVFVWTKGGYNANRFFGSYPIFIRIPKTEVENWKTFLKINKKKFTIGGMKPKETLYGIYYVLLPVDKLEFTNVGGLNVEPLEKTVDFCIRESFTYEPALAMLDKEYNLNLGKTYETRPETRS